jgi:hypothetical protein
MIGARPDRLHVMVETRLLIGGFPHRYGKSLLVSFIVGEASPGAP